MLDYLQTHFNIPFDIRNLIMNEMKHLDLCRIETKNNKRKYKEVIKSIEYYSLLIFHKWIYFVLSFTSIEYYSYLNKMINKRKHKDYNLQNTINHFDT